MAYFLRMFILTCSVLSLCFGSVSLAKKNKEEPTMVLEYKSTENFPVKEKTAPGFTFKYPSNYHVHSYDGQSINLNDWRNPQEFANSSVIVKWRKKPFSLKEESMYLKLGNGKSNVNILSANTIHPQKGKKVWAVKAKYELQKENPIPVTPPASYQKGKGKSLMIKPEKASLEETVLNLRCGSWNVLINYKARAERDYEDLKKKVDSITETFDCS